MAGPRAPPGSQEEAGVTVVTAGVVTAGFGWSLGFLGVHRGGLPEALDAPRPGWVRAGASSGSSPAYRPAPVSSKQIQSPSVRKAVG